jgi:hypothetical protein
MNPQVTAAIIGVSGSLAGIVATLYRDEIKNTFSRVKEYDYLLGDWKCVWEITSNANSSLTHIEDQVAITSVNGKLVKAEGVTADHYGKWHADGKANPFVVSLTYSGDADQKYLVGVVILKKESPAKLIGVWSQFFSDGGLKGGTTAWTKIS